MKSEPPEKSISYPKLSIFENFKPTDPPGMLTPPLQTLASVPFTWEEAPGKPRQSMGKGESKPKIARSLELPPRLLMEVKVSNSPSPTATIVVDGPFMVGCTALSASLSFRRETKERGFGSRRWGSLRKNEEFPGVFSVDSPAIHHRNSAIAEMKITKAKRKKWGLFSLPRRSHLLASIYDSLKQVVPCRRRPENSTKVGE